MGSALFAGMSAAAPVIIPACEVGAVLAVFGVYALMIGIVVWSRVSKGALNNERSPMTSADVAAVWLFSVLAISLGSLMGVCLGVSYQLHHPSLVMRIAMLTLVIGLVFFGLFGLISIVRYRFFSSTQQPRVW